MLHQNYSELNIGSIRVNGENAKLKIAPLSSTTNSSYSVLNKPQIVNDSTWYRPKYSLNMELEQMPEKIIRNNQEYQLALQYAFKGTHKYNKIIKGEIIRKFNSEFIPGFRLEDSEKDFFANSSASSMLPFLICNSPCLSTSKSVLPLHFSASFFVTL